MTPHPRADGRPRGTAISKKPLKWFSIASLFPLRENSRRARLREFTQLNCDLIGEKPPPPADAEMIALVIDLNAAPCGLTKGRFLRGASMIATCGWIFLRARKYTDRARPPNSCRSSTSWERGKKPEVTAEKLLIVGVERGGIGRFFSPAPAVGNSAGALGVVESDLAARGLREFVEFDPRIVSRIGLLHGRRFSRCFDREKEIPRRWLAAGRLRRIDWACFSDGAVQTPCAGFSRVGGRDAAGLPARLCRIPLRAASTTP